MTPFILLAVGLFMVFVEFYLPGGIMGILGGLVLLASIILFAIHYQSTLLIIFYVICLLVLLFFLFKFALFRIRHARPGRSIYLNGDQEGYFASEYEKEAIGKIGIVDTDLKPGGHIIIEGKRYLALSQSGYISRGNQVIVVGGEGESLMVKQYKKEAVS